LQQPCIVKGEREKKEQGFGALKRGSSFLFSKKKGEGKGKESGANPVLNYSKIYDFAAGGKGGKKGSALRKRSEQTSLVRKKKKKKGPSSFFPSRH